MSVLRSTDLDESRTCLASLSTNSFCQIPE
jgi:hypothetical protein